MATDRKAGNARGFPEYENPFAGPDTPDRRMIQRCIHCGSCVTSCPTFTLLGSEMDSPRGRIYIMRLVAEGEMAPDEPVMKHLDRCLDCRACETACPSGVPYGSLIEAAREGLEKIRKRSFPVRVLRRFLFRRLLPNRTLLRLAGMAVRLYQATFLENVVRGLGLLPKKLAAIEPMMP